MKYVVVSNFGGIAPRFAEHTLDIYQATAAHNVRLRHGKLEAWREKCHFADAFAAAKTFYLYGCHALAWSDFVNVAETTPDWGRFYITGHNSYPEVVTCSCKGELSYSRLGLPAPGSAPMATGATSCERSSDARAYVYTFVNRWGEESAPSDASNVITVSDGADVTLTNIEIPDPEYDVDHINIYRAVTGVNATYGTQKQELNTEYLYVDSIPVGQTVFLDTFSMTSLGSPLETLDVNTPPAALTNLVSFGDVVRLGGNVKNRLYFSEYFEPYNWPVKYELTLDNTIVHMMAQKQLLYITTDTVPYVIDTTIREGAMGCAAIYKGLVPVPDIGCKYASTTIMTNVGMIYVSPVGLVLLKPDTDVVVLTKQWFSPEEWAKLAPDTARIGFYQNYLFCITDRISFILNINTNTFADMHGTELVTISDKPIALFRTPTDELLMLEDGKIWVWDKAQELRPYLWESRELTGQGDQAKTMLVQPDKTAPLGTTWSPASAKVKTDGITFTLISPLQNPAYTRFVENSSWFRLPRIGRNLWYKVRFEGVMPVEYFTLGTSNFTINVGT